MSFVSLYLFIFTLLTSLIFNSYALCKATLVNPKTGQTVGKAGSKASVKKYAGPTSKIRKQNETRDACENHMAQELLKLAKIENKNYITVTTEIVEGWSAPIPVLTIRRIEKKLIPKLKILKFKFSGNGNGCRHPEVNSFLNRCDNLNFVRVQHQSLKTIGAGYDIDKLEFKLAHPLLTEEHVANIIQHNIQKNPKWDAKGKIICKPFPKKEDDIKKIDYYLSTLAGGYAPCRVKGCPSQNRGPSKKGFCTAHYNEHGEKFACKKPWGRIGE